MMDKRGYMEINTFACSYSSDYYFKAFVTNIKH
jgi:hypothetical protein